MVSILRSRTHKFKHESVTVWIQKANHIVQGIFSQWLEDATLLETMLKTWIDHGPILSKSSIMDNTKEKAAMRRALTSNKNFKPLKNGTMLLSKWRGQLKSLHLDAGLPNGQKVLTSLGETINASLQFTDLTEMIHGIVGVNDQKNVFLRKAEASKFKLHWKAETMGDSISKSLDLLLKGSRLELTEGQTEGQESAGQHA